jgi:hypothetical protein
MLYNDNVTLSVHRENDLVYYNLRSKDIECKTWIEKIVDIYNSNLIKELKNKLIISGQELIWQNETSFKKYYYAKTMWAINWYVIEKLNYQHYEYINSTKELMFYNYVLEPIEFLKLEDDLFLTIKKKRRSKYYSNDKKNEDLNNDMDIQYILYSNEKNIKNIVEKYLVDFENFNKKETENKKMYHFTYSGLKDNNLVFNSKILSEENTDSELFETFDKLHHEHVEYIKQDIDKLKDLNYYKKHGLKRKKGYLFHGKPGCGKTSTVVAMALYDKRHIVEVPFSLITKHEEFEKIMNLNNINNIEVNNNNIILLFDEIDIGMDKINEINNTTNESPLFENKLIQTIMTTPNDKKNTTDKEINLATLLSRLDGIGNYNGLIIVATTNNKEKLNPALYRELRLTDINFDNLRKIDCINIIQSYFGNTYDLSLHNILKDRKITPVKLIYLCQKYENTDIELFYKTILNEYFCK